VLEAVAGVAPDDPDVPVSRVPCKQKVLITGECVGTSLPMQNRGIDEIGKASAKVVPDRSGKATRRHAVRCIRRGFQIRNDLNPEDTDSRNAVVTVGAIQPRRPVGLDPTAMWSQISTVLAYFAHRGQAGEQRG
jgi:hypothetical protein